MIDCLTANGNPHPPIAQRIFWSFSEGAVATALLKVGGKDSLDGLQAVSIIAGVPYTVVICLMCKGLWDVLAEEHDKQYGIARHAYNLWQTSVIDVLDYPTFSVPQVCCCCCALGSSTQLLPCCRHRHVRASVCTARSALPLCVVALSALGSSSVRRG